MDSSQQEKRSRGRPRKTYARRMLRATVPEVLAARFEREVAEAGLTPGEGMTQLLLKLYPEEAALLPEEASMLQAS